jgi:hypothetical protein
MIRVIGSALILVIVLWIFYDWYAEASFGFEEQAASGGYLRLALSGGALFLGIVFGSLHRQWQERKGPLQVSAITDALRSADLWRSLLLAPLVFSGAYAASQEQPDFVLAFVVAFQSGFFCDTVLQRRSAE